MPLWDAIELVRFRRFENLKIEGLKRFNLLVGRNNSGKTSVLEAVAILCHPLDLWTWLDTARAREMKSARTPIEELLRYFFPQKEPQGRGWEPFVGRIEIASTDAQGRFPVVLELTQHRVLPEAGPGDESLMLQDAEEPAIRTTLRLTTPRDGGSVSDLLNSAKPKVGPLEPVEPTRPRISGALITPVTHRTDHRVLNDVSQAVKAGGKPKLLELLRLLDPAIDEVEILSPAGRSAVVNIRRKGVGFLPLSCEGDGVRRALMLAATAYSVEGGILLLDEVETALHASGIENVLRFLLEVCRRLNIQVFATTHSLEAVDAIVSALGDQVDEAALFRLPSPDGQVGVRRFSGAEIARMRTEYGFDLR